jgi:hypothetical protein
MIEIKREYLISIKELSGYDRKKDFKKVIKNSKKTKKSKSRKKGKK